MIGVFSGGATEMPNTNFLADPGDQETLEFPSEINTTSRMNSSDRKSENTFSRDEMNLAEFPLAVLSTRVDSKVKTLEFTDSQRLKTGEVIERKWIITGADKFGLPTATDDDVVLGLMRLSMEKGFRERKVYFTRYELLKVLRWSTEGRSYTRLTKSLDRLSGVRIRASNSFFDNSLKAYQTKNFGIIDSYEINGVRGRRSSKRKKSDSLEQEQKSYFVWSEVIFDSFRKGFIKKLDLDLYFSIKSSVGRRLYRYLDKHFYYKRVVEKDLMTLAFEKLGLSRNYKYVSSIKQQLEPGADELVKLGFLESYDIKGRGCDTRIRFVHAVNNEHSAHPVQTIGSRSSTEISAKVNSNYAKEVKLCSSGKKIAQALARRGIALSHASRFVNNKTLSELKHITRIIHYFDYLVEHDDRRISRNPIGFLYRAVESPENFNIPKEFKTEEEIRQDSRKRPELRVIKADNRNTTHNSSGTVLKTSVENPDLERQYKAYITREVKKIRSEMSEKDVAELYLRVIDRIRCLKDVLDDTQYQRALEGCVKEDIIKKFKLPDFSRWAKGYVGK